jgi:CubicO group peptidase (beta-lactamase class C family)
MKRQIISLILAATATFLTFGASASNADNATAEALPSENAVNSYSIALRRGTEPLEFINSGRSTENTVYEVGSNGKMIAAYIALKLVEEGKLSLDTKVYPLLNEEFLTDDSRLKEITVGHLLSHTGGFSPSFEFGVDKNIYFDPGTEFMYSGVGYIYLQNVIETVTGLPIESAAREYVFSPLGMNDSTFESAKIITPYMLSSTAVLFSLLVFIASFIVIFVIGIIAGKIIKNKGIITRKVFVVAFVIASAINIVFLVCYPLSVLSKVVVVFAVYAVIAGIILFIARNKGKLLYIGFLGYTVVFIALGIGLNITIPVTGDLVPGEANAAYSLKSTSRDMAVFCEELMAGCNAGDGIAKDMFRQGIQIDDQNSWGLGIAIEDTEEGLTYWHSGINPGFQSLVVLHPADDSYIVVLTNSDKGLEFAKNASRSLLEVNGVWDIKR